MLWKEWKCYSHIHSTLKNSENENYIQRIVHVCMQKSHFQFKLIHIKLWVFLWKLLTECMFQQNPICHTYQTWIREIQCQQTVPNKSQEVVHILVKHKIWLHKVQYWCTKMINKIIPKIAYLDKIGTLLPTNEPTRDGKG